MFRWVRLAALIPLCLGMTACSQWSSLKKGGAEISDQTWMLDQSYPAHSSPQYTDFIPYPCPKTDAEAAALTATPTINACVYAMLQLIDVKWVHFQDALLASSSTSNFAADSVLLGLGTAGSFVTGSTTQILHAISAGVTGLRSSFNQDILYSQTITTILLQMEADRSAERAIIMAKLTGKPGKAPDGSALDTSPYTNMYQAANDLFFYARAGSWTHSLLSIQKSAATSKGNAPSGATTAGSATGGSALPGINFGFSPDVIVPTGVSGNGTLTVQINSFTDDSAVLTFAGLTGNAKVASAVGLEGNTQGPATTVTSTSVTIPNNKINSVTISFQGLPPGTVIAVTATGIKAGAKTGLSAPLAVAYAGT